MVKYVVPSFEILSPITRDEVLRRIELAGRTCYKSEDMITPESAAKFVKMIVGRGHMSVIEHCMVTVKLIAPRGVSHEVVRHRLASYSQESTRFCNYGKQKFGREITVIDQRPLICAKYGVELIYGSLLTAKTDKAIRISDDNTVTSISNSEKEYIASIDDELPPEIARGVLPIDLKTEIVMTANLREWLLVFSQRCAPAAHPNMRQIMIPLREEFRKVLPEIFGEVGSQ